jgi:hypothetical protein
MSYSEVLETTDNLRVVLVADEYADEPYDDGQSPLLQLDIRYSGNRAEHKMVGARPTDNDARIEEAACRWGSDLDKLEKYLRAYYGATQVETWHSGSYWYITYDTTEWREYTGAPVNSVSMDEWRAWCEGDVWGWTIQKHVTWHTDDPDYDEDRNSWEDVESCWGYYGHDYAESEALSELRNTHFR